MIDISSVDTLELTISADGKKLWINTSDGCKFRAYNIAKLIIKDERGPAPKSGYDRTTDRYFEPNQGAD